MAGSGGGARTEKPTAKRRKKARGGGQLGNSPELGAWLGLLAASFVVPHVADRLMQVASTALLQVGGVIRRPEVSPALAAARQAVGGAFGAVLPLALLV